MRTQRSFRDSDSRGTLFLVPTPLGNLQDMTFRAVEVLKAVDLIAAEDTRHTQQLLRHFDIRKPLESLHEYNWAGKVPKLLSLMKAGQSIAQVSDAGLPSISDPGRELVAAAIEEGISVVALPGPSAGITGLIASGLLPQPHVFLGFLPRKKGEQVRLLEEKKLYPETQIIYESPHRVVDTVQLLLEIYGNREAVFARELTKIYEEYRRGKLSELLVDLTENPAKGECLLIVAGYKELPAPIGDLQAAEAAVTKLLEGGLKRTEAIKNVARDQHIPRQELYKHFHRLDEKNEKENLS